MFNNMIDKTKSNAIDYVKCIGIVLVIFGHYPNTIINILKPYMYHMPLFFFLGGILFNTKKGSIKHYKNLAIKYLLYIIMSYVFLGLTVKLMHYLFETQDKLIYVNNLYDSVMFALKSNFHNNPLFMVGWFLLSYMLVLVVAYPFYKIIETYLNETTAKVFSFTIGLAIGYVAITYVSPMYKESKMFYFNTLCQVMVGLSFFMIGYAAKNVIWKFLNPYTTFTLFLSVIFFRQSGLITNLYMSWSTYADGFVMSLVGALIGIYIIFFFADLFSKAGDYKLMRMVGSESKAIMTFHMLSFTIVDIILSLLGFYTVDKKQILNHFTSAYSLPLNILIAIFLSILLGKALRKLSKGVYA